MKSIHSLYFSAQSVLHKGLFLCFFLLCAGILFSQHSVTGRVVYGKIKHEKEDTLFNPGTDSYLETMSIFDRGIKEDNGIPFVTVKYKCAGIWKSVLTDSDGYFTFETSGCTPNSFRVIAKNDYCKVKEAKDVPLPSDKAVRANFGVTNSVYSDYEVTLPEFDVDDYNSNHVFAISGGTDIEIFLSRALFIAGNVHRDAKHIEEITGLELGMVWVRYGWGGGLQGEVPWYDRFLALWKNTIHLPWYSTAIINHEYGHHISAEIGAFGIIPNYVDDGSHSLCSVENECWAFLEGLASWYGAVNSNGFVPVSGVDFFGAPVDTDGDGNPWEGTNSTEDPVLALGDNWWVEKKTCSSLDYADRRSNESVVAQVLWDLVDPNFNLETERYFDETGTGLDPVHEVAEVGIDKVLAVLTEEIPAYNPCNSVFDSMFRYPVTLDQFCETYIDLFPADIYPDLYAAYSFNGVMSPCLDDTEGPAAVFLHSPSHNSTDWTNEWDIRLSISDGYDDFSGTYHYYGITDLNPVTDLSEDDVDNLEPFAQSKETSLMDTLTSNTEGEKVYVHVQTRDLAWHLGMTAHIGPLKIDTTRPVVDSVDFPDPNDIHLIGTYKGIYYEVSDALSGVEWGYLSYSDPTNDVYGKYVSPLPITGGYYEFYLNPDDLEPSTTGFLELNVLDSAGNVRIVSSPFPVYSPFDEPNDFDFEVSNVRVVSGDLNGDGSDEVVMSGLVNGAKTLKIMHVSSSVFIETDLYPGLQGGDLFLADVDRDDDLDILAGGWYGSGQGRQIYLHLNNGSGSFTSMGALPLPKIKGMQKMVFRVADFSGNGDPILMYGGVTAGSKYLRTYNFISGITDITNIEFRGGDFEIGDVNADGIIDVVTLGLDVSGEGALSTYLGGYSENEPYWIEAGSASLDIFPHEGDIDLGNWDDDKDLELFMMYKYSDGSVQKNMTGVWDWTGIAFTEEKLAAVNNRIANGDGHFVAIYNDGRSDVLALGARPNAANPGVASLSSWYLSNVSEDQQGSSGVPAPIKNYLLKDTDTAFGDFDNDGDMDMIVGGTAVTGNDMMYWYENQVSDLAEQNDNPPAPTNLMYFYDALKGGYVFQWAPPTEDTDETPLEELQYEIQVGTSEGLGDIISWAHPAGQRQQSAAQPVFDLYERFVPMPMMDVFWKVRSVDNGWRRSAPVSPADSTQAVLPNSGSQYSHPDGSMSKPIIYPNPANQYCALRWEGTSTTVELSLYDQTGKMVLQQSMKQQETLQVEFLPPGLYSYQVQDAQGTSASGKLSIMR